MDETPTSKEPTSPERNRSRSPPPPPAPPVEAVVEEVAATDVSRRTCPVCLRVFDSAKAMWGHSWVHRERRDQIHSMAPPGGGGGGVAVAMGPTDEFSGSGGSGWHPWKIDSKEERDRTCPKCSKVFGSPKAMYGHLHVHYDRSPRRAKGEKGESSSSQAGSVVDAETPVAEAEPEIDEEKKSDSPISIDLNRPICMEDEEDESSLLIDLNRSPPSS